MNLKERIQTVLQKLNLLDKAKANQLTQEEWGQIVNSYNQEYQSILQDDLAADQAAQRYRPLHSQPTVKAWFNWPPPYRAWLTI